MSTDEDDSSTWARALAGDVTAFGAIFDRHRDRAFRHAVYHLGNREDAEDATAAAFLELWRRRATVRVVDGSVLPWILVTTTNVARNIDRARRRYRDVLRRLPRQAPSTEEAELLLQGRLDAQRRLAEAAPAIDRLGRTDRDLLMLTAVEEMPVATAAEALGISAGAARTRLHRVKTRLREELGSAPAEVSS